MIIYKPTVYVSCRIYKPPLSALTWISAFTLSMTLAPVLMLSSLSPRG